jgi:hypothetical protein
VAITGATVPIDGGAGHTSPAVSESLPQADDRFGLSVQSMLGHMPFAVSTAIHVPLGVGLFAATVILAIASSRAGDIA